MATLKRYSMAIFFLLLIVVLMLAATLGVKSFGDKMFEETQVKMKTIELKGEQ